jgi:hypothetical protein
MRLMTRSHIELEDLAPTPADEAVLAELQRSGKIIAAAFGVLFMLGLALLAAWF